MSYRDEFEQLLKETKIGPNITQEELEQKVFPLINFIRNNVPERLFKFRACTEHSLSAFEKDELWLSKAAFFNDLHDSLLFFDKQSILKTIEAQFSSGHMLAWSEALIKGETSLQQMHLSTPEIQQQVASVLSSTNATQLTDLLWKSLPQFDVFLDQCFSLIKEQIRNSTKMVCLSESINSPLMWAHYADNNKGFALGYDFRNNEITQCSNCPNRSCNNIKLGTLYPVIYSDKRFDATSYGQWFIQQYLRSLAGIPGQESYDDNFLFTKCALYKSSDWVYEHEWRIICSTPNQVIERQDRYSIQKRPIAIYFGCQIPDIYKKILTNIADEKGIAKYQMKVKNYSSKYQLDYEPI